MTSPYLTQPLRGLEDAVRGANVATQIRLIVTQASVLELLDLEALLAEIERAQAIEAYAEAPERYRHQIASLADQRAILGAAKQLRDAIRKAHETLADRTVLESEGA